MIAPRVNYVIAGWVNYVIVGWVNFLTFSRLTWGNYLTVDTHADRPDLIPLQELLDLCHTVTVLLYHIVFCAIGYEGVYTDYSTHGWPTRKYPPETENAVSTSGASSGLLDKSREDSGRSARS